jgi:hypothetical protein
MTHKRKSLFLCLAITLGISSSCGSKPISSEAQSAQEPHRLRKGPWFEGWYARSTDLGGKRSIAVIVGSHVPQDQNPSPDQSLAGYIGILYSEGDGSPTRTWTFFPGATTMKKNGAAVTSDPNILKRDDADFSWEADGYGSFHNNHLAFSIPGQVEVEMDFSEGKSWNEGALPLGPEGYLAGLPVPLHWYVKSLNSPSNYRLKVWNSDGSEAIVEGKSQTHIEKNWGAGFPKAWNWLQGVSIQDDAQLVLGGGTLGLLGVDVKAWLAGYRSAKESWDLRSSDPSTRIVIEEDSCSGSFRMIAKRIDLEVEVIASAPKGSFGPVAVPTPEGFVPDLGVESFSAKIEVLTYRRGVRGKKLTDQRTFTNGALEFGAGSYRKACL